MSWTVEMKCEGQCCGCSRQALKGKAERKCDLCRGAMCDQCGTRPEEAGHCRTCLERLSGPSWMTSGRHG